MQSFIAHLSAIDDYWSSAMRDYCHMNDIVGTVRSVSQRSHWRDASVSFSTIIASSFTFSVTGEDLATGRQLSTGERWMEGVSGAFSLVTTATGRTRAG